MYPFACVARVIKCTLGENDMGRERAIRFSERKQLCEG